eukprot:TRINITY_DN3023_c0_g1_i1.p1 TRINITY_DN3023_c0_g1~~TRINITY_DN3023_c0_g1_i1.p1  ORF type:complete len:420 (-),score=12.40 TRINITY_DN3023_c0_g1_i1:328-1587(-)
MDKQLPAGALELIFSCLDCKTIGQCRLMSKLWDRVIRTSEKVWEHETLRLKGPWSSTSAYLSSVTGIQNVNCWITTAQWPTETLQLLGKLQHLRELDFLASHRILPLIPDTLADDLMPALGHLQKLILSTVHKQTITFLPRLVGLQSLTIASDCENLGETLKQAFPLLTNLRSLRFGSVCLEKLPKGLSTADLPSSLELLHCELRSSDDITYVCSNFPNLTSLDISETPGLTASNFQKLSRLTNLRELHLRNHSQSSKGNFPIQQLLSKLKRLEVLNLAGHFVPDLSVAQLRTACPALKRLTLQSEKMSVHGLKGLYKKGGLKQLQFLDLCGCTGIDGNELLAVFLKGVQEGKFPKLQKLLAVDVCRRTDPEVQFQMQQLEALGVEVDIGLCFHGVTLEEQLAEYVVDDEDFEGYDDFP